MRCAKPPARLIVQLSLSRVQNWIIAWPPARGANGIVVAQARLRAEVGAEMLAAGGTAADAAVTAAFTLAAVEPWNSGLGSIGFGLVHPGGEPRAHVVDFGPVSSARLDPVAFPIVAGPSQNVFAWPNVTDERHVHGPRSFVVPSAVAGYAEFHRGWGRLPWKQVLAPAIGEARAGLAADWFVGLKIASAEADLRRVDQASRIYLPGGLVPAPPSVGPQKRLTLGRLADILEHFANPGAADFYHGELARAIMADVGAIGGVLDDKDLSRCSVRVMAPSLHPWRDAVVQGARRPAKASTLPHVLEALAPKRFTKPDEGFFLALAEALQTPYRERLAYLGDQTADPRAAEACMSHLTAVDADGTMVSLTSTLLSSFGSRVVLPTTGILMNAAAHHPRIDVSGETVVAMAPRLDPAFLAALRLRFAAKDGEHTVLPVIYASPNFILRETDGTCTAISDIRMRASAATAAG